MPVSDKTASDILDEGILRFKNKGSIQPQQTATEGESNRLDLPMNIYHSFFSKKGSSPKTTPAQFKVLSQNRNESLNKLRDQYNEGNDEGTAALDMASGSQQMPFLRQIVNPMTQELSDDKVSLVAKIPAAILHGLMGGVMSPYSEASEAISNTGTVGKEIVSGVNKAMNLPFEAVNKGSELTEKFFDKLGIKLPTIGNAETDKKLRSIAMEVITLYLMGKGYEAIKNHLESKYPEIKNIPKEEVPNENQNQETNFISSEQGKPSIEPTADQTKGGTPQGNGEGLNQEKAPQTLKWIEPEKEFNKPLYKNVLTEYSKGYPLNSPELEGYRNENLPTAEVFKKLDDLGLTDQVKETQKRLNTLPTNDPQSIGEDFEKIARITLREAEKKQTPDIGTNSRETDRETQNSGTLEDKLETPPTGEEVPIEPEVSPTGKNQRVGSLKPIEGTGETKQRGLSKNVEATAIAAGITKGFENLPQYNVRENAPQIQKAAQIIANDPKQAMRMVTGKEKAPDDVLPGFLYTGLKEQAAQGKLPPEMLQELAQSDWLSKQLTTAGQIVQSVRGQGELTIDPIKSLNDIVKAREENFAKRTGREGIEKTRDRVVNQIAGETKKNNLQLRDWGSFIKSIECA